MDPQPSQVQLQADLDLLKGRYANNLRAVFTAEEFLLDFSLISPGVECLVSRVVVSPGHLKRISDYLQNQLKAYEEDTGEKLTPAEDPKEALGFKPPQAPENG